jgi:hypothetical protein
MEESLAYINGVQYPWAATGMYKDKHERVAPVLVSESGTSPSFTLFSLSVCWWRLHNSHVPSCKCSRPPPLHDELAHAGSMGDSLAGFKHRGLTCNVTSLELHRPSGPTCNDRVSVLRAMSSGGRIGKDAPYLPRGCDMSWFTTKQVCEILGRYSQVVLVGDSMLRHIMGAMSILIREDLGYGGVTDWNFSPQER